MKIYVAMFYGDISDKKPIMGCTLDDCLDNVSDAYGYGKENQRDPIFESQDIITPDPEDDKIEVWEFDSDGNSKIVWGFWGWHWEVPEVMEQGIMPGHDKSLYALSMD